MYKLIIQILVIAGAINWGLLTLQNIDIVKTLVGSGDLERYIKIAIGAAGLYYAYLIYNNESIENFSNEDMLKSLIQNVKQKEEKFTQVKDDDQKNKKTIEEKKRQEREEAIAKQISGLKELSKNPVYGHFR